MRAPCILGKTNLSEWANFRSTHSSSGWSGRGGQTKNPYALDRNPSGSSSGSGQRDRREPRARRRSAPRPTARSCRRRTTTRWSASSRRSASSAAAASCRSRTVRTPPGPMARSVADAALILAAIAGADPDDKGTMPGAALRRAPPRRARRLVACARRQRSEGRAHRRGQKPAVRRQRGRRPAGRGGDCGDEEAGRGDRRPGEHHDARQVRRPRVRDPSI